MKKYLVLSIFLSGCFSEKVNEPITLDASRDTTFVIESNGNDFINFRYSIEGYVQDSVKIEVSYFKKAKGNENVKLDIPLKAGKVKIKNKMWDFYASKAIVEFKHLNNRKGKLIIKAEI
jgi:hypothetical protein